MEVPRYPEILSLVFNNRLELKTKMRKKDSEGVWRTCVVYSNGPEIDIIGTFKILIRECALFNEFGEVNGEIKNIIGEEVFPVDTDQIDTREILKPSIYL